MFFDLIRETPWWAILLSINQLIELLEIISLNPPHIVLFADHPRIPLLIKEEESDSGLYFYPGQKKTRKSTSLDRISNVSLINDWPISRILSCCHLVIVPSHPQLTSRRLLLLMATKLMLVCKW